MKALVLAAGRGSRLGESTARSNKCMLELFGKPLLQYSLGSASRAAVSEIVVVVGYRAVDVVDYFGSRFEGTEINYVHQDQPQGLVHAIETAAPALGEEDFMLFLADEILWQPNHGAMIRLFYDESLYAVCGVVDETNPEEIRKTYSIIQDQATRRIHRLIEKPRRPPDQVRGTGNCIFRREIIDYIPLTPINQSRGEKELPDLIQCAVDDGEDIRAFNVGDGYVNINEPGDIAIAELEYSGRIRTDEQSS